MALAPDQQAILQLLLVRGQSYGDLAALLEVDEAEVRRRARAALTVLGGADPDRNVELSDYLLGQADPIGRADASRQLRTDADDHALAETLTERLRELIPGAELPRLPGEPRRARRSRAPRTDARPGRSGLSQSQTRLIVVLASAAVLVVAAVLAITGAFGGDGEQSPASPNGAGTETATTGSPDDEQIERVALEPVGGGDAGGEAVFGLTGDQAFVEISIDGLDPAPRGQTYVVWLMLTPSKGYPLSPITASQQGTFEDRFSIPATVLPVVARVRFVDVSIAAVSDIRELVQGAIEDTSLVLDKPGETVLRGAVPRGPAAAQDGAG